MFFKLVRVMSKIPGNLDPKGKNGTKIQHSPIQSSVMV